MYEDSQPPAAKYEHMSPSAKKNMPTNASTKIILNMNLPAKNEHAHANKEEKEAELFVAAVHRMGNCLGKRQ